MATWLAAKELAMQRGIGVLKVYGWIRSGNIEAISIRQHP
jgi:hypothetical protein